MNVKQFLRPALAAVGVAAFVFFAHRSWLGARRTPRLVVLVVVDTLRHDEVQAWAAGREADVLRRRSVAYERAYSASGWTLPAVASILTGVDPEVHHAHGKHTLLAPISPDVTTLAEAFRDEGYRTIAVTNAAFLSPLLGLDRGFDVYDHEHAYNRLSRPADETLDRALGLWIEAAAEDTFLFVHLFDPHLDYDPTPDALAKLDGAQSLDLAPPITLATLRELEAGDGPSEEQLQAIRALYRLEARTALDEAAQLHDSLNRARRAVFGDDATMTFALTADHGEEFYEHGGFEHGHSLHAELVHVPLWIDGPDPPKSGRVHRGVVSTRDLGRHLLELEGLPVPETFAPSTSDWEGTGGGVSYSATTLYGPDRIALRTDDRAVLLELQVEAQSIGVQYDLAEDPHEEHPGDPDPELVRRLLERRRAARRAGESTRRLDWQDLGPSKHAERDRVVESLRSLGYTD